MATRERILDDAVRRARIVGLEGLSIGELAGSLGLSKSGLFAHFGSKEQLQIEVIRAAEARFVEVVVRPSLTRPRGEPRFRAFLENWIAWGTASAPEGGCFFVAASAELDDRPGAVRDELVRTQRDWLGTLARAAEIAIEERHFRADVDPRQVAFEAFGIMTAYHHSQRLLRDPEARPRAERALVRLIADARPPKKSRKAR